ncbi:MAG: hypothetical protein AAFU67_13885, partial [Bacteroidota bacterium]
MKYFTLITMLSLCIFSSCAEDLTSTEEIITPAPIVSPTDNPEPGPVAGPTDRDPADVAGITGVDVLQPLELNSLADIRFRLDYIQWYDDGNDAYFDRMPACLLTFLATDCAEYCGSQLDEDNSFVHLESEFFGTEERSEAP